MKNHHKRRSMHRAAAFTQSTFYDDAMRERLIVHPLAIEYQQAAKELKRVLRDRHPITLEKLDGE